MAEPTKGDRHLTAKDSSKKADAKKSADERMLEGIDSAALQTSGALAPILAWADAESLVPLLFAGAQTEGPLEGWVDQALRKTLGAGPQAVAPAQADLLVIVGAVAQKAGPVLQRVYSAMAEPRLVLHIGAPAEEDIVRSYAAIERIEEVVPVDVVVEGTRPTEDQLTLCLHALKQASKAWRGPPALEDDGAPSLKGEGGPA